jgi:hypothetical protein
MTRLGRIAGIVGVSLAGSLLGCNSILGIDIATPEPGDAQGGSGASGTSGSTSGVASEGGTSGTTTGSSGASGSADAGPGDSGPPPLTYPQNYEISCDNYCNLIMEGCPVNDTLFDMEYESLAECMTMCTTGWEPSGPPLDPANEPMPLADTLACRVWHANAVLEGYPDNDPHTHCPHAGPLGGEHCDPGGSDYCVPFCRLDIALCNGDNAQYAPGGSMTDQMNACLAACEPQPDAGYPGYPYSIDPTGNVTTDLVTQGDTINCRMYHLENAVVTPTPANLAFHCPHTSLAGGGASFCGPDAGM